MLEKTLGEISQRYRACCTEFLAPFPVRKEGADPSVLSLLLYLKSIKFQEDQEALMKDFDANLFHEEGIDCIVLSRDAETGEYSLRFEFLPWTIT